MQHHYIWLRNTSMTRGFGCLRSGCGFHRRESASCPKKCFFSLEIPNQKRKCFELIVNRGTTLNAKFRQSKTSRWRKLEFQQIGRISVFRKNVSKAEKLTSKNQKTIEKRKICNEEKIKMKMHYCTLKN